MKWTEEKRKTYGIFVTQMTEETMRPSYIITINGYSTTLRLTAELIQDLRWQVPNPKEVIDDIIDEEIEKHPEFQRNVRKMKLKKIGKS